MRVAASDRSEESMTPRAIAMLGIGQCVNWGVLYYAFAVFLLPVQRDLGVDQWLVAGAFSIALLMSAAMAPTIGRWADRGDGPRAMRLGGYAAGSLLAAWAIVPNLATLYLAWAALGVCMAATLYEPAFAIVGRAIAHPADRLRALSTITVFGGLASTVFLPVTAALTAAWGWRPAAAALGAAIALSTYLGSTVILPVASGPTRAVPSHSPRAVPAPLETRFRMTLLLFCVASFASAAFTATAVTAFVGRGLTPGRAAMLAGLMGVMQLPGRAFLMLGALPRSPSYLLTGSLALQAAGLVALAALSPVFLVAGVAMFAVGSGLMTLLRPHLVQSTFGIDRAGHLNGMIARAQQLSRAAGPIAAAALAGVAGYGALFGSLAIVFAAAAIGSRVSLAVHNSSMGQEVI
jgi:MFS family permease